jgi:hypothetical protein
MAMLSRLVFSDLACDNIFVKYILIDAWVYHLEHASRR